jgi:hypothetical protein
MSRRADTTAAEPSENLRSLKTGVELTESSLDVAIVVSLGPALEVKEDSPLAEE